MKKIELQTDNGDFVTFVHIPDFTDCSMPNIIIWGLRHFVVTLQTPPIYIERFAVTAFTKDELKQQGVYL